MVPRSLRQLDDRKVSLRGAGGGPRKNREAIWSGLASPFEIAAPPAGAARTPWRDYLTAFVLASVGVKWGRIGAETEEQE